MKVTFETNAGTFTAYLNSTGDIVIYHSDDDTPVAVIPPLIKRRPALDTTADGVARAVRGWLEDNLARLEIQTVTARLTPPGIAG